MINDLDLDASRHSWTVLRDAVVALTDRMRDGGGLGDAGSVAGALIGLAQHDKWEVRAAVAEALEFLQHDRWDDALEPLLRDSNRSVRRAAERTRGRRSERTKSEYLSDEYALPIARAYGELEAFEPAVRDAARRAAERHVHIHVRASHHQLVKPLNALHNKLVMLDRKLGADLINVTQARRDIRIAQRQAAHLLDLMANVRDFASVVDLRLTSETLRDIVTDALDDVKPRKRKAARIAIDVDPALLIEASRSHLRAAFANILKNSFDAVEGIAREGEIRVTARAEPNAVVVTVTDNGCGIPAEHLGVVMKLFCTTKAEKGGTGVGLSHAKRVVESHGGTIRLESIEGSSTTVTLTLPRKPK